MKQKLEAGEEVDCGNLFQAEQEQEQVAPVQKEYTCEVCNLTVPTEASMEFHLNGM